MAGMITRCPKCATAFRISEAHLESAKGKVRCGNCLDVFNAKHYIQPAEANDSAPPGVKKSEFHSAKQKELDQAANTSALVQENTKPSTVVDDTDESWALELLKDDTAPNIQIKKIVPIKKEENKAKPNDDHKPKKHVSPDKLETPVAPKAPEEPITSATPETEPAETPETPEKPKRPSVRLSTREFLKQKGFKRRPIKSKPERSSFAKIRTDIPEPVKSDVQAEAQQNITPKIDDSRAPNHSINHMLAAIEPDALEVDWVDEKTRRKRLIVWSSLSLAAGFLLCIQVAWLKFHQLNRVEPYRTAYSVACVVFRCTIPAQKNLRAIATSNLVVRSHPTKQNALMVDVILQNNARFEQTFPGILLTFSDLAAKPVAARRFTAQDYLGGELAGVSHMPIRQPIHIAIEIQDPGISALSYNIAVVD